MEGAKDGKYWFGSICIGFEDERYHCKGQKRLEEPDPEPNKGLDPGSPEPVSRSLTALPNIIELCGVVTFLTLELLDVAPALLLPLPGVLHLVQLLLQTVLQLPKVVALVLA